MPRRKPPRKRKLTAVEIMVLAAIFSILISIMVPAIKKHRSARPGVGTARPLSAPQAPDTSEKGEFTFQLGTFVLGFVLGVGATIAFQHQRARSAASQSKTVGERPDAETAGEFPAGNQDNPSA